VWANQTDGTREQRVYYRQNPPEVRGDRTSGFRVPVSGGVFETVRYSSYGVPFGIPPGVMDGDGRRHNNDDRDLQLDACIAVPRAGSPCSETASIGAVE
jgi:hypothetical protein